MKTSIFALAVALATPALAESGGDIVVTAARIAQPADQVGQSVTVIDAHTIQQRQTVSVADLLATTPGVTLARNGGQGSVTSLFLRGANSEQTLVLIDGVRVNDPSSPGGGFDFGNLLAGPVKRIEVLRGSNSVAYGSDAIGGVINITSETPGDTPSAEGAGEYGYSHTGYVHGTASGKVGPATIGIGAAYYDTDGISQFDVNKGGRERDGYRNTTLNARATIEAAPNLSLDLRGYYINARVDTDGFSTPTFTFGDDPEYTRSTQYIGYAGANLSLFGGHFTNRLAFTYFQNDRHNVDPSGSIFPGFDGTKPFDGRGRDRRLEYQGVAQIIDPVTLVFGYEHDAPSFRTSSYGGAYKSASVNIDSGYALAVVTPIDTLSVTAGLRHDDHSLFGGATTFGANGAWTLGPVVLRASYGEGFKAPTLYQLLGDYGNPALNPERSKSYDGGATLELFDKKLALGATYFARTSRNLISFVNCSAGIAICAGGARPFGTYNNTALAKAHGVELDAAYHPDASLTLAANYTLTDVYDRSVGSTTYGKRLARRPASVGSVSADWTSPWRLAVGTTARFVGHSFDNASNSNRLAGYTLVDLRASFPLTRTIEVYARVENLFDKQYETVLNYGTYGRAAYGGVRVKFGG